MFMIGKAFNLCWFQRGQRSSYVVSLLNDLKFNCNVNFRSSTLIKQETFAELI